MTLPRSRIRAARAAAAATALVCASAACGIDTVERAFYSIGVAATPKSVPADGVSAARVRVTAVGPHLERVTFRLHSTAGVLSQSSAFPGPGGEAEVLLYAPLSPEAAVITASIDREAASYQVTFTDPAAGKPALALGADPPAILADGKSESTITARATGVADGTAVAFSTTAGTLAEKSVALKGGQAATKLRSIETAGTATVSASAGEASGKTTVQLASASGPQFELVGSWAVLASGKVRLSAATLVPNPQDAVSPTLQLVELAADPAGIRVATRTCDVKLPPAKTIVGTVSSTAPPALVAAIPVVTQQGAFVGSDKVGASYRPSTFVLVMGAKLDDPAKDPLPTSPEDPRLRDDDKDGRPGVTVQNSLGGDQNVVFRLTLDVDAKVQSSIGVEGTVLVKPETQVFGIGNAFVPQMTPLPGAYKMRRVDGKHGSLDLFGGKPPSCAELVARQQEVFK